MAYTVKNVVKDNAAVTVGASATNAVLTGTANKEAFAIQGPFMRGIVIDVECSGYAAGSGTGVVLKLQVRHDNSQAWADSKTATVTANGTTSIRLLDTVAGDQTFLPLKGLARVVATTGDGAAVTVDAVYVPYLL